VYWPSFQPDTTPNIGKKVRGLSKLASHDNIKKLKEKRLGKRLKTDKTTATSTLFCVIQVFLSSPHRARQLEQMSPVSAGTHRYRCGDRCSHKRNALRYELYHKTMGHWQKILQPRLVKSLCQKNMYIRRQNYQWRNKTRTAGVIHI
jgi:hypothetical protein